MNQLEQRISSREVAEMMEMEHKSVLRKIDEISQVFTEHNIVPSKYWEESQYKDASGKSNREYQVTKRGCEFLAHKSTGTKGNLFTDRYMDRFAEMEQELSKPKPLSALEQLTLHNQAILEVNDKVDEIRSDLDEFKEELPLLGCDMDRITTAVKKMGVKCLGGKTSNAYKDKSIRQKVYTDIYDQLKRQFGVTTYKSIKRNQCDTAIGIVECYQLPMVLKEDIECCNAQESFA